MKAFFNTVAAAADTVAEAVVENAGAATEAVTEAVQATASVGIMGKIKEHGLVIGGVTAGIAVVGFAGYKLNKKLAERKSKNRKSA